MSDREIQFTPEEISTDEFKLLLDSADEFIQAANNFHIDSKYLCDLIQFLRIDNLEGRTQTDIAAILGISESSVRKIKKRFLEQGPTSLLSEKRRSELGRVFGSCFSGKKRGDELSKSSVISKLKDLGVSHLERSAIIREFVLSEALAIVDINGDTTYRIQSEYVAPTPQTGIQRHLKLLHRKKQCGDILDGLKHAYIDLELPFEAAIAIRDDLYPRKKNIALYESLVGVSKNASLGRDGEDPNFCTSVLGDFVSSDVASKKPSDIIDGALGLGRNTEAMSVLLMLHMDDLLVGYVEKHINKGIDDIKIFADQYRAKFNESKDVKTFRIVFSWGFVANSGSLKDNERR
ncbi:helix-turn-helix domain-containing protein [Cerasicoccus frondis]|uniref:helix-turn-helix domain-containing protein n=1 Tax=Cerasicoccus frondis TaxID=490090 RepID=UPI00285274E9|nr:helix-turn-helix domain-containing protein [Cerasicoccus frondis]